MAEEDLQQGNSFSLTERITIIGRAPLNEIVLDAPTISRRHASIRVDYRGCWIEDLGTRNGTFVNGQRLGDEPRKLRDSDRIEFGQTEKMRLVFVEPKERKGVPELVFSDPVHAEEEEEAGAPGRPHTVRSSVTTDVKPGPTSETISQAIPQLRKSVQMLPLPRNVQLAMFGALMGGELIIILLLLHLIFRDVVTLP